jgi:hypothetical protein
MAEIAFSIHGRFAVRVPGDAARGASFVVAICISHIGFAAHALGDKLVEKFSAQVVERQNRRMAVTFVHEHESHVLGSSFEIWRSRGN